MMKAIKNFMKKPITWGDSFKWSGIVLGLYAAVIGTIAAYEKWIAYKDKAERLDKSTLMRMLRRFMRMAKLLHKLFAGLTGHARTCILRITSFKKIP